MRRTLCAAIVGLVWLGAAWPQPAEALFSKIRLPLAGCRGYLAAKGSVTYTSSLGETDVPDGQKLVIEIENVPLPEGTELLIFVHEKEVGTLKLDKGRGGRFEIVSSFRKLAPSISTGSFIVLMLDDGTKVMW